MVLEGLQPGEQVITSSYEEFNNVDTLDLLEAKRKIELDNEKTAGTIPFDFLKISFQKPNIYWLR